MKFDAKFSQQKMTFDANYGHVYNVPSTGSACTDCVKSINGVFPDINGNVSISNSSLPRIITVTLDVDNWVSTDLSYSQTLTLDNITPYSRLDLQPDTEIISDMKSLGVIFITKNTAGKVFVESVGNRPTKTYSMQATIVETEPATEVDAILGIPVGAAMSSSGGQELPEYVQSLDDCVDTSKVYVLPDGYVYKYVNGRSEVIAGDGKSISSYSGWYGALSSVILEEPIQGDFTIRIKGVELIDGTIPMLGGTPCAVFVSASTGAVRITLSELTVVENSEHGYEYFVTVPNSQTLHSIMCVGCLANTTESSKLVISIDKSDSWCSTALVFIPETGADFKSLMPTYPSGTTIAGLNSANKAKQYTVSNGYTYKYVTAQDGTVATRKINPTTYSSMQLLHFNVDNSDPTVYPLTFPVTLIIRNMKLTNAIEYNGDMYALQFYYPANEPLFVKLEDLTQTAGGYEYIIESGNPSFQVNLALHEDNSYYYDYSMSSYSGYYGQLTNSDGMTIYDWGVDCKYSATGKWEKVTEHRFVPSDFDYTVSNLQQTVNQSIRSINWKYGEGGNVNLTFDDIKPQFAYSTAECWDKTKDYLLPDGYVYRYNDGYQSTYSYENVDLCVLDEDTHTCYIDNYTPFCGHDNASLPYTFVIKNLTLADRQTDEGYGAVYVEVNEMSRWFTLQELQSTYVDGYVFQLNENYYGSITINNINIKMFVDESAELVQPTLEVAVYEGRGFQPTEIRFFPQDGSISGSAGGYYTPYVTDDGWLSWTPSDPEVMPTPGSVNIKGPQGEQGIQGDTGPAGPQGIQGEKGNSGVYIGAEEPTDGSSVWIDLSEDSEDFSNEIIQEVLASLPIYDGEVEDI